MPDSISVKWDQADLQRLHRRLDQAPRKALQLFRQALRTEAEQIMRRSKQVTPVDTGTLRSSGHVQSPVSRRGRVSVTMGYGGAAQRYALYVHEAPVWWSWSARGTGPKYLERPVKEARRGMGRRLADMVDRLFR